MSKTKNNKTKNKAKFNVSKTLLKKHGIIANKIIHHLPENLRDDKEVVMKALEADQYYFESISNRLKDDKDVAKKALNNGSQYFQYLSDRLRDDKQLAMKVLEKEPGMYWFISDRLKIDLDILKITDFKQISVNINEADFFKEKIEKKEFLKILNLLQNVKNYKTWGFNLISNMSDDIKNDKELVMRIVSLSKRSYNSLTSHLKNDKDVIECFIRNNAFNQNDLKYLGDYNKDIALLLMQYKPGLYRNLKPEFIIDKDVIIKSLNSHTKDSFNGYYIRDNIPFIPIHMREDKDIKAILDSNHQYYFPKKNNDDKKFILNNVKHWNTFKFVSKRLQNDKDVVMAALSNPNRRKYEPNTLLNQTSSKIKNDKNIFLKALDNKIKYNKNQLVTTKPILKKSKKNKNPQNLTKSKKSKKI